MSSLTIHTRCLSARDPWGTYLSMHLSRRTTRPSIIVTFAARDTSLEIWYPSRRAIRPSKWYILLPQPCLKYNANDMLKWKWGHQHFDTKAQLTTRNTAPTNKQQVSKSFSTSHKKIHEFHTLDKSLETHLPQINEQSLQDLCFPLSLSFQTNAIYSSI